MISSRTKPDDAASPPLSVDDVDRPRARPRLQRIGRKNISADDSASSRRSKQAAKPAQIEAASGLVSGPPKSGLTRVARKTDSSSEKRRKKLARIRAELANRKSKDNGNGNGNGNESVLANRVTEAIRQSSAEKSSSTTPKKTKRKKKRGQVGWVLDPKAVEQTLDSRIAAGANSSDAQAVSSEALHAELELRRILALSTANFQLDACPTFSVTSNPQPDYSPQAAAAEVRPVVQARKAPVKTRASAPESIPVDSPVDDLDVDLADAMQAVASPRLSLVEPAKKPVEPYGDWFKRVVVRNRWLTWFTTFYIHWIALLLLAAIIVHGPEETAELLLSAAFATEEDTTSAPFEMTVPVEEVEPVPEPEAVSVPADEAPQELEEEQLDISESILNEMVPQGVATAEKSSSSEASESKTATPAVATQHVDRAPAVATRQGSFSVWTEPSNPRPGDPYRIIIQVRLPEHTKKYLVTDLEGVVVGSDGYRKPIPGFATGELPIVDGYARLAVPIVSADKKVRDTVFIRSRLLRETQKLLVEF